MFTIKNLLYICIVKQSKKNIMERIIYIRDEVEKINPDIFLDIENNVIIDYRHVTFLERDKSDIKIKKDGLLKYVEIFIENGWKYEIEIGMGKLYLWKNTDIMCSKDIERLELIKNNKGNIERITII